MIYTYSWTYREEGEPTEITGVIARAYESFKELRVRPFEETFESIRESTEENPREELVCYLDGKAVAFACLVLDEDLHVGRSISVQWNVNVSGETLLWFTRKLFKRVKELSKIHGIPYSYTKRIGDGKYQLTYKGI